MARHSQGGAGIPFSMAAIGLVVGAATENTASMICFGFVIVSIVFMAVSGGRGTGR